MKTTHKDLLFVYYKLFKPGGVARVLVSLANYLVQNNYNVTILVLMQDKSSFYALDDRVKIISIDTFSHWGFTQINTRLDKYAAKLPFRRSLKNYIYDFGQWQMLGKWINNHHQQYDLIISCWYKISAQLALNKNVSQKTIAWEHANFEVGGKLWKDYLRVYYKNLKGIVCINSNSFKHYIVNNKNTHLIPNIIGEPFESVKFNFEKENTLIFVGRLDEDKNVVEILEILRTINLNDFKFKIIGDGPQKFKLENIVNQSESLKDKVKFLGNKKINDVLDELIKSKIFLFTSKTEGLPTVLIEAMMTANALIAYNCNYGPSDIINEKNGFLIPMYNKDMFREKLQFLIDHPTELDDLCKSSFQESKKWHKEEILKLWEIVLNH